MKILHISDTHGGMPVLPDPSTYDVIVHSGDMLPNKSYANKLIEPAFQQHWVETNAARLAAWLGKKPFIYTPGNHDYYDPCPLLREAEVLAYTVCDEGFDVSVAEGPAVMFWGFPWTPMFCGWNWMCEAPEMAMRCEHLCDLLDIASVDVLISHGPMFGILDRNADGTRCGSKDLRFALQSTKNPPKLLLHGHIHEAAGLQGWSRGMVVSNAACTMRVVTV